MKFSNAISDYRTPFLSNYFLLSFFVCFSVIWISTFVGTTDVSNWFIENSLVVMFVGFLIFTYRRFKFSDLSYLLIAIYLCLHVYGSMYTYAENPFGFWLQEVFDTSRNQYDRIVHFSFGFLLAYPMREGFMKWFKFPKWVCWVLPIEITLSISGLYELVEWSIADIFFPEQGDAYLGTQGDIWDAQKDMFLATLGAILATSIVSSLKRIFKMY